MKTLFLKLINYSACICPYNEFIGVWLEYEINMTDSLLLLFWVFLEP